MDEEREDKPVDINSLPPERQKKVREIRARLRKGTYVVAAKEVDDKTIEGLSADIDRS